MRAAHTLLGGETKQEWTGTVATPSLPGTVSTLVRQIGAKNPARCPECLSIVYSRRHKLCGVCSKPLPDYLLFATEVVRSLEHLLASERTQHRKWMNR